MFDYFINLGKGIALRYKLIPRYLSVYVYLVIPITLTFARELCQRMYIGYIAMLSEYCKLIQLLHVLMVSHKYP